MILIGEASWANGRSVLRQSKPWFLVLGLYCLALPLDSLTIIPGVRILTVLALVAAVWGLLSSPLSKMRLSTDELILFLYLLLEGLSVAYSINYQNSKGLFVTMLLNIGLVLFFAAMPCSSADVSVLRASLLLASWLTGIMMLVTRRSGMIDPAGRLTVAVGQSHTNSNMVCIYMYYGVANYMDILFKPGNKKKIWAVASLVFFAVMVLLSGSRGGLLGYLAVVATIVFMHIIKSKSRKKAKSIILALLLFALVVVLAPHLLDLLPPSVARRFSVERVVEDRGSGRVDIWLRMLNNFSEGPVFRKLFGYGLGTGIILGSGKVAHNEIIEVLVALGFVGLAVYLLLMFRLARICWNLNEYVMLGIFMGMMMISMSTTTTGFKSVWNIVLIILMIKKTRRNANQACNNS